MRKENFISHIYIPRLYTPVGVEAKQQRLIGTKDRKLFGYEWQLQNKRAIYKKGYPLLDIFDTFGKF